MSNEEQLTEDQQAPAAPQPDDTSNIKLDLSKSVPAVAPNAAPDIKLDMSKSVPIAAPAAPAYQQGAAQATGIGPRPNDFHSWLQDLQSDVRNGTASTWVGSLLSKLGAKGTSSGNSEQIGDLMAGPVLGIPKAIEGGIEVKRAAAPIVGDIARGSDVVNAAIAHPAEIKKAVVGANKVVGGAFQSLGTAAAIAAPEGEALAVVVPAMVAQSQAQKAAVYMGADPDTAELIGNVAGLVAGKYIHSSLNPTLERFGVAVNNRTAAEQEYVNRSRNLETARGQAAEVQQRAVEAAANETNGTGKPADTDAARQLANEAAKNVGDAQKAFDQASKNRADATIELEKLHRKITTAADKVKADEYQRTASESKKAMDLVKQAVPSKGANQYSDEDMDRAFAHVEEAKAGGAKIKDLPDFYNAVEEGRQKIEDNLFQKAEPYKNEPVTTDPEKSPKLIVANKLAEMAKVDGNFADAMDNLSDFNITDPTVGETKDMITKLNNYQRAAMKGANNWDIYNMVETNPEFAARFFMTDALRDALHDNLEGHGIENSREARNETASLVRVRDAIGAQIRANRGGVAVRGSGSQSAIRSLVAKLVGKTGRIAGAGIGAEAGGVPGAVIGAGAGEMAAEPIQNYIAPRDMTRDEHIEKAAKLKMTNRKPTKITGEGTPAVIPTEPIPPMPKAAPQSIELTPRENTDLHADLAAHYGVTDLDSVSYDELERDLRKDVDVKKANGQESSPAEKNLLGRILKADTADRAARAAASVPAKDAITNIPKDDTGPKTQEDIVKEADARALEGEATKLNPHLVSLGRSDESALVSHSPAMKAHAPAAVIPGLSEGVTSEDAHLHEWAHLAIGAVDGLEPIEIRSDIHPKSEKGAGATAVFNGAAIRDAAGNIDPEALGNQETQWLTQKMAGPASHEVFKGMTREEVKASPATRSDFRNARAIVREVHPDFTPKQVEQLVDAAYDRARDFLTKPHIADRIRANAAVREEGLSQTLHASHGRVNQFAEDIRNAHNEYTGTDTEPDGSGAGEGGEKAEKPAAEEGKKDAGRGEGGKPEGAPKPAGEAAAASGKPESIVDRVQAKAERNAKLREENSNVLSAPQLREIIPEIKSYPEVEQKLKDLGFESALQKEWVKQHRPEKSVPLGNIADQNRGPNIEESNISKAKAKDVLDKIAARFGTSDNAAAVKNEHSFITPEGKFIHLEGTHHNDAIAEDGGDVSSEKNGWDNRPDFLNKSGAVRSQGYNGRNGENLSFSVPKGGVTPEQVDAMRRATAEGLSRNGTLNVERADVTGATKNELSKSKDFPRGGDLEQMLRDIKAHPDQITQSKIEKAPDQVEEHEKNGGSTFTPEGKNLAGEDTHAVGAYPERTLPVDKLTPEVLEKFKADNADLLGDGKHAIGTWKDPDTGKTALDIVKTIPDREEAIKAGQDANQKAIYNLKTGETIPTGGTGEGLKPEESQIARSPKGSTVPLMKNPLEVEGTGEKFSHKILEARKEGDDNE
jgi:hypothetical protein